jgi:hypothetical protein
MCVLSLSYSYVAVGRLCAVRRVIIICFSFSFLFVPGNSSKQANPLRF